MPMDPYEMRGNQMNGMGAGQMPGMGRGQMGGTGLGYFGGYDSQQLSPQPDRRMMSFQNFANQQGPQPQKQEVYLTCKIIDNPDHIMPIDIPTNGDPACFIMQDFSAIYLRAVNSRGTIDNVSYQPVKQQTPEDIQKAQDQQFRDAVFNRLTAIEDLLTSLIPVKGTKAGRTPKATKQDEEVTENA